MKRLSLSAALALGVTLSGCGGAQEEEAETVRPVRSLVAAAPATERVHSYPGLAEAETEVNLSFRVGGRLVQRLVEVGQEVAKGDIVAQLDPTDFELEVARVEGELGRARAALQRALSDLERQQNIRKEDAGATTQKAIDRAEQLVQSNQSQVRSLEAQLRSAMNQLDYATLRAPFDGRVVATYVENFEDIQTQQAIVRLLDNSKIEMTIYVPEVAMQALDRVTAIQVRFDQMPDQPLSATIKKIGTEASAVTRTYPITLLMTPREEMLILAGMAGNAQLSIALREDELLEGIELPSSAIGIDRRNRQFVWVIDPELNEVMRRYVEVGRLTDGGVTVTDGVSEGDVVVISGVTFLNQGQQVELMR